MVHLQEGFGEDLPVAAELDLLDVDHPERCRRHLGQESREGIEPVEQRPCVGVEVDELPAAPRLATHRWQASLAPVEIDEVALVGHPHELPGKVVAPRMELTGQHARRAATRPHHRRAPMPAGVVEPPHDAVLAANQQDRSARDLAQLVAARARQLRVMRGVQPHPLEQVLVLQRLKAGGRCNDRAADRAAGGNLQADRSGPPRTPNAHETEPDRCCPRVHHLLSRPLDASQRRPHKHFTVRRRRGPQRPSATHLRMATAAERPRQPTGPPMALRPRRGRPDGGRSRPD